MEGSRNISICGLMPAETIFFNQIEDYSDFSKPIREIHCFFSRTATIDDISNRNPVVLLSKTLIVKRSGDRGFTIISIKFSPMRTTHTHFIIAMAFLASILNACTNPTEKAKGTYQQHYGDTTKKNLLILPQHSHV